MILSHKYKFIFIRTLKTAGTSIEIALSKFCGKNDIVPPITPEDEETRRKLGYTGPQNYFVPFRKYSKMDWAKFFYKRKRLVFRNHNSARFIKEHIDEDIWNTYFKFCFERNPWDKVVSGYFWMFRNTREEDRPSLPEFINTYEDAYTIPGVDLYTINGRIVVNKVFKFEELNESLEEITKTAGLPEVPILPKAKAYSRKDKRNYRELLTESNKDIIAKVYAREIAYHGYTW